jgi:RepB DNA-primase from phage plasmid
MKDTERDSRQRDITPTDYIRANFQASDRIAVLLRNPKLGETIQRIATAEKVAGTPFQEWMHYKNEKEGFDVYLGMNALKPSAFTRTKDDILAIRHLYVDLDHDGSASLAAIEKSADVPCPNFIVNTSPDKYQAIWKVEGIEIVQAEALLHAIAREFDGDPAATDAARVLRIPGFMNKKYDQDFLVTARCETDRNYDLRDFKLRTEPSDPDDRQPRHARRNTEMSEPPPISQSERDWAYVNNALRNGANPEELIRQLARSRASDKSDPEYYARLTVTKATAELRAHVAPASDGEHQRDPEH